MKNAIFSLFAAWMLLLGCSNDNKDLSREEAMNLIKQETKYPKSC